VVINEVATLGIAEIHLMEIGASHNTFQPATAVAPATVGDSVAAVVLRLQVELTKERGTMKMRVA
jgi:ABC-type anion transport system duplicated permease subunit